ncbi:beta-ketoacyl synthase N-terminal-like domain-containing protein [Metabacillus niabensis]|uniref:beta-ketoacyl synthase N-terminal-like domain-containing protein n=1 Tax=Metabacillus niabensis TaxID=324854 RepID=UPI001CFB3A6B|nr:beta-ketoacyl synthase N-terminal-like domain-containing protein [Metabacillus niabensis]
MWKNSPIGREIELFVREGVRRIMDQKVFITGMTVLTSYGSNRQELQRIINNDNPRGDEISPQSWISEERQIPIRGYKCSDSMIDALLEGIQTRSMDRFSKLNVAAVKLALQEALLEDGSENTGYLMSTTFGPWQSTNKYTKELVHEGPINASPRLFPNTVLNSAQGQVAKQFKLKGVSSTITGVSSIPYAYSLIRKGAAERILVAGAEELNENMMEAFQELGSPVVHGEGVGVLLLESEKSARHRHATIYGEILDYEMLCDTNMKNWFESADANGRTLIQVLSRLESRRVPDSIADLKVLISGRNGSKALSAAEDTSFREIYSERLRTQIKVVSPKNILGETFGASSVLSTITALQSLENKNDEAIIVNHEIGGNQIALRIRKGEVE